ncbi:MAG TPA: NUDIX domain-containing protein [Anaerolineales bacterium]|nr:NUDIX domain-containing protein [Anaerolineales bacterium]
MRIRAGIILIQDNKVALIERHRAGLHYFVFPGGGVEEGESLEQAAIRETMEELGIEVVVKRKVAEIHLGPKSRQVYFLVEQTSGSFGTGNGAEFTHSSPDDPGSGVYVPIWMPIEELSRQEKVFPVDVAKLVLKSVEEGWPKQAIVAFEEPK